VNAPAAPLPSMAAAKFPVPDVSPGIGGAAGELVAEVADPDELHQAQGMAQLDIGPVEALASLRTCADTRHLWLGDVARDLVARTLRLNPEPT
jgi:hypothetical protein